MSNNAKHTQKDRRFSEKPCDAQLVNVEAFGRLPPAIGNDKRLGSRELCKGESSKTPPYWAVRGQPAYTIYSLCSIYVYGLLTCGWNHDILVVHRYVWAQVAFAALRILHLSARVASRHVSQTFHFLSSTTYWLRQAKSPVFRALHRFCTALAGRF